MWAVLTAASRAVQTADRSVDQMVAKTAVQKAERSAVSRVGLKDQLTAAR
jgi:hypothetical protein